MRPGYSSSMADKLSDLNDKDRRAFRTAAVEMAGRNWLTAQLLHRGLQVAVPVVDHGIDLIVFKEGGAEGIRTLPLQLKCASDERFSLHTKYKGRGIPLVYIWNALSEPRMFVLTYDEALAELGEKAAKTASWDK